MPNGSANGYVVLEGASEVNQHANVYIKDKGDGLTTFDSISFVSDIGQDRGAYPDTLGSYIELVEGDFVAL